jgi:alpha-tubulin suppressor-like RCC1 family protein
LADGSLWGVGSNEFGQLGLPIDAKNPQIIESLRQIPIEGFDI